MFTENLIKLIQLGPEARLPTATTTTAVVKVMSAGWEMRDG